MAEGKRLQSKGIRQYQQHEYEESIETFKEAITAYEEENDEIGVAEMRVNLGLAYRSLDQFDEALASMETGLNVFREKEDRNREAQALGNMALVYAKQDNEEQATTLYREAADIFRDIGDDENYGQTILALADMQFKAGNLMQAASTFEIGLEHIHNPSARQKMAKQLLVVKNRLTGQRKAEEAGDSGKQPQSDRRRRRSLRRNKGDDSE